LTLIFSKKVRVFVDGDDHVIENSTPPPPVFES